MRSAKRRRRGIEIVAAAVMTAATLAGCASSGSSYPVNTIEVEGLVPAPDGTLALTVRLPAESAWYCPGADLDESGDMLLVSFLRVPVGDTASPDLPLQRDPASGAARVLVPNGLRRTIVIDDGTTTRRVWR